jgi:hypothetical protein
MADPLEIAKKKLAAALREAAELRRFIETYEALAAGAERIAPDEIEGQLGGNLSTENTHHSVDNPRRRGRGPGVRPTQIAEMMERLIREIGTPLTRGQIVEALERRDVEIPAQDKQRYIGTIAWRKKSKFINIDGLGYWLRGEPMPRLIEMGLENERPQQIDLEELARLTGKPAEPELPRSLPPIEEEAGR